MVIQFSVCLFFWKFQKKHNFFLLINFLKSLSGDVVYQNLKFVLFYLFLKQNHVFKKTNYLFKSFRAFILNNLNDLSQLFLAKQFDLLAQIDLILMRYNFLFFKLRFIFPYNIISRIIAIILLKKNPKKTLITSYPLTL